MVLYYLGVDIGSLAVKAVLLDELGRVVGTGVKPAGYGGQQAAMDLTDELLTGAAASRQDVAYTVATGYGRVRFTTADEEVSEVSCHARGAYSRLPEARTVIDVGGQDSKAIRLDARGRVVDFAMNDKCAAGTGRFLEVMAGALGVPLGELGSLALGSASPVPISSTCTVFAESEAISHIARGASQADVAAGLHLAIVSRILGLVSRVTPQPKVVMTGGVALNSAVVEFLSRMMGQPIHVPPEPQMVGALGAALLAQARKRRE